MRTGKAGRPKKVINLEFLRTATAGDRQIRISELAKAIGVHRNTLSLYMKQHGVMRQYSNLSNKDLNILVKTFKSQKPESGLRYLIGFLWQHGLQVQRRRVVGSLK